MQGWVHRLQTVRALCMLCLSPAVFCSRTLTGSNKSGRLYMTLHFLVQRTSHFLEQLIRNLSQKEGHFIFRLMPSSGKTCIYVALFVMFTLEQWHEKTAPPTWNFFFPLLRFCLFPLSSQWRREFLFLILLPLKVRNYTKKKEEISRRLHLSFQTPQRTSWRKRSWIDLDLWCCRGGRSG